jgi:hypothetical protein
MLNNAKYEILQYDMILTPPLLGNNNFKFVSCKLKQKIVTLQQFTEFQLTDISLITWL